MKINSVVTVRTFWGKQLETLEAESLADLCNALDSLANRALMKFAATCFLAVIVFLTAAVPLAPYDGHIAIKAAWFIAICVVVTPLVVKVTWLFDEYEAYTEEFKIAERELLYPDRAHS